MNPIFETMILPSTKGSEQLRKLPRTKIGKKSTERVLILRVFYFLFLMSLISSSFVPVYGNYSAILRYDKFEGLSSWSVEGDVSAVNGKAVFDGNGNLTSNFNLKTPFRVMFLIENFQESVQVEYSHFKIYWDKDGCWIDKWGDKAYSKTFWSKEEKFHFIFIGVEDGRVFVKSGGDRGYVERTDVDDADTVIKFIVKGSGKTYLSDFLAINHNLITNNDLDFISDYFKLVFINVDWFPDPVCYKGFWVRDVAFSLLSDDDVYNRSGFEYALDLMIEKSWQTDDGVLLGLSIIKYYQRFGKTEKFGETYKDVVYDMFYDVMKYWDDGLFKYPKTKNVITDNDYSSGYIAYLNFLDVIFLQELGYYSNVFNNSDIQNGIRDKLVLFSQRYNKMMPATRDRFYCSDLHKVSTSWDSFLGLRSGLLYAKDRDSIINYMKGQKKVFGLYRVPLSGYWNDPDVGRDEYNNGGYSLFFADEYDWQTYDFESLLKWIFEEGVFGDFRNADGSWSWSHCHVASLSMMTFKNWYIPHLAYLSENPTMMMVSPSISPYDILACMAFMVIYRLIGNRLKF